MIPEYKHGKCIPHQSAIRSRIIIEEEKKVQVSLDKDEAKILASIKVQKRYQNFTVY